MIRQTYFIKRPFLSSLAIVIILFVIFFAFFVPVFLTNDDVAMMMVASGTGLGGTTPDEHILFINVIIGFFLKRLYTAVPYFPWYGLFAFSILFLSTVALLYSILRRKFSCTRILFFLLFFAGVELYFLVNTQFTFTAYLSGAAGIFLFLSAVDDKKYLPPLLFALLLLIVSSLIRIHAFYMALLLGAPLISIKFIKNLNVKAVRRYAFFFLTLLVLSTVFLHYQRSYYENDQAWREYQPLMNASAEFSDYRKALYSGETKHIFDEVGWSNNDLRMLVSFFKADDKVFSLEKMERVLADFPPRKSLGIKDIIAFIKSQAVHRNLYVVFFAILALFFISYSRKDKLNILKILTTLGWIFVLMAYIIAYKYLKDRVYFSMISFFTFTTLFYADKDLSLHWPKGISVEKIKVILRISFLAVVLFFQGVTVDWLHLFSQEMQDGNLRIKRAFVRLNPSHKKLFVVWANSFPYRLVLPFDNLRYLAGLSLVGPGMAALSDRKMLEFNIKNFAVDLCNRQDIYLMTSNMEQRSIYRTYMREHYGLNVSWDSELSNMNMFKVRCY